ncbi:dihydrofolate reductase family protein [Hamadaea sp. NPDC051192]|uniref:dihydrofolate reductase family protein n=1 Tax=Hamadaea sp. NPDC051192 TaxID=3154940 RepID=UPI003443B53B
MTITFASQSISLDGFSAGPQISDRDPMGVGGERLHDWMFATPTGSAVGVDADLKRRELERTGAVVIGRTMYEVGLPIWKDTPYPRPTVVLTNRPEEPVTMPGGTFTFASTAEAAHEQARLAAGDRDVLVLGGATTIQAFLAAGLIDELTLQLVPLLLGGGTRLFANLPTDFSARLTVTDVAPSAAVTHLTYRLSA